MIFLDRDAGGKELAVQRARSIVEQPVLDARLQEQRHAHAARGSRDERTAKIGAREEVRRRDEDLGARCADRRHVRLLDVAAVAQVVANHEFRGLRAHALRHAVRRKQRHVGSFELRDFDDRPDTLHRLDDRHQQRALHADGEINPRRLVPRRMHVVDDVDAADEGDPAVDVAQLAMQAAQPMRAKLPRRDLRAVFHQLHAAVDQRLFERSGQVVLRAPAVDQQPHGHAAARGAGQRLGNGAPRRIVGEDIGLEPDFLGSAVDCADQRRKVFAAVAQEPDRVAGHEAAHRLRRAGTSNVAASAAWSDIRFPRDT